jgi:diguanylate cyclase (GGDEF)-like protein
VPKRRGRIALLIDSIDEAYQGTVLSGVLDAARAAEVGVLCFCGGVLAGKEAGAEQRNAVYELVDAHTVDGLIVMSGAIGNVVGAAEMSAFCASFRPMPVVSVAAALEGVPSVVVDDDAGMREAVAHVVTAHGRSRFAFVRGPQANQEAERRYRVFREVLAEYDLPVHPDCVVGGTFERASGEESVAVLLDERRVDVDAIVAASDEMAIGAVRALAARGVRVPEDIAVIGFDDVEAARFCLPPLTTVRQPLHEQGRVATELLLAQLRGERVPERVLLHTALVTRRSCGCGPDAIGVAWSAGEPSARATDLAAVQEAVTRDVVKAFGASPRSSESQACARTVAALVAELGGATGEFLRAFEDVLRERLEVGDPIGPWQDGLTVLRRAALAPADAAQRPSIEELLHTARKLAARYAELAQADRLARAEQLARSIDETSGALATSFDRSALMANLGEQLPRLGIERAYFAVYRERASGPKISRLLFAVDADGPRSVTDSSYPSKWLVPDGILPERRLDFVVQPLFFEREPLGVALLELGPRAGHVHERLRDHISAALKGSDLVQRVIEHDRQRQRLLRHVLDVTPDMQRVQPLADLYPKILSHSLAMLDTYRGPSRERDSSLPPRLRGGLLASVEGGAMIVRASTDPRQIGQRIVDCLDADQLARVQAALERCAVESGEKSVVIPLRAGDVTLAIVHMDAAGASLPDAELLSTLANQASAAIRSTQLYELAALDSLTGAHTRRFFDDWVLREVKAARRSPAPMSLLMIDMDGMKLINDGAGHLAGDQALAAVSKALRESTRPSDLVGRFGGDEFVVLLPRTGARAAEKVAQRMIDTLARRDAQPQLRISIGASTLPSCPPMAPIPAIPSPEYLRQTVDDLLKHADEALYRAKRQGGMRVCSGRASTWAEITDSARRD